MPKFGYDAIIDPDFDDEWEACALLQHEMETSGAIELHPDGNRLDYDPVPLHTRVYADNVTNKRLTKEWKKRVAEYQRRKLDEQQMQLGLQQRQLESLDLPSEKLEPKEHHWLLRNMRLDEPIPLGLGRVWRDYVMINKSELDRWLLADPMRRNMPTIWSDQDRIIFQYA